MITPSFLTHMASVNANEFCVSFMPSFKLRSLSLVSSGSFRENGVLINQRLVFFHAFRPVLFPDM